MIDDNTRVDALNFASEQLRIMMQAVDLHLARYGLSDVDHVLLLINLTTHLGHCLISTAAEARDPPRAGLTVEPRLCGRSGVVR